MDLSSNLLGNQVLIRGRNSTIGTAWEELYDYDQPLDWPSILAAAAKVDVTSSSATDASAQQGCKTLRLVGLDGNYQMVTEVITMNGQTAVTSALSYLRLLGAECETVGTSMTNVGDIHIVKTGTSAWTSGVPNTLTSALLKVPIGFGRGMSGLFTTPAGSSWRLRALQAGARTQATILGIFIQGPSKPLFAPIIFDLGTSNLPLIDMLPYNYSVPEKTDIRMRVISGVAGGIAVAHLGLERVS
jgi:hypothetical protein